MLHIFANVFVTFTVSPHQWYGHIGSWCTDWPMGDCPPPPKALALIMDGDPYTTGTMPSWAVRKQTLLARYNLPPPVAPEARCLLQKWVELCPWPKRRHHGHQTGWIIPANHAGELQSEVHTLNSMWGSATFSRRLSALQHALRHLWTQEVTVTAILQDLNPVSCTLYNVWDHHHHHHLIAYCFYVFLQFSSLFSPTSPISLPVFPVLLLLLKLLCLLFQRAILHPALVLTASQGTARQNNWRWVNRCEARSSKKIAVAIFGRRFSLRYAFAYSLHFSPHILNTWSNFLWRHLDVMTSFSPWFSV